MDPHHVAVVKAVQAVLTRDLKKAEYDSPDPLDGHCYHASEAVYHLLGGPTSGYTPYRVATDVGTHWYLVDSHGRMLDVTDKHFEAMPEPDEDGVPMPFYTRHPSRRAAEVIRRVRQTKVL